MKIIKNKIKNIKKLKGGILDFFMKKELDIKTIIDCIIKKKAEKLASYYYLLHKKDIIDIDDFLNNLFINEIDNYIEKIFKSFIECMKHLLKHYIKFKNNRKFISLGNLIYILNNYYNNINFSNYGSEAHILYCIDNPNELLKNKCYYDNILNSYLNYYNKELTQKEKDDDKNKIYTLEEVFKKIGYDIAIYIFLFTKNDFKINNFGGFSEDTKKRIKKNFNDIFKLEFKSLFDKNIQKYILATVYEDEELKKMKLDDLEEKEKFLFEQQKYNLYKYGILEFKNCERKNRDFVSFKNSVLIFPKEKTFEKKLSPKKTLNKLYENELKIQTSLQRPKLKSKSLEKPERKVLKFSPKFDLLPVNEYEQITKSKLTSKSLEKPDIVLSLNQNIQKYLKSQTKKELNDLLEINKKVFNIILEYLTKNKDISLKKEIEEFLKIEEELFKLISDKTKIQEYKEQLNELLLKLVENLEKLNKIFVKQSLPRPKTPPNQPSNPRPRFGYK
jgi:hypothetical protein